MNPKVQVIVNRNGKIFQWTASQVTYNPDGTLTIVEYLQFHDDAEFTFELSQADSVMFVPIDTEADNNLDVLLDVIVFEHFKEK